MSQNFHHYLVLHVGSKYTRSQLRYIIIIIIIIIKIITTVILNATNIVFIILDLVMVLGNFWFFDFFQAREFTATG